MDINAVLIYVVSNFVRVYIIYRYYGVFFKKEKNNKINELLLYTSLFFATSGVTILFNNSILNLLINMLILLIITRIYKGSTIKKILSTVLIYVITLALDVIVAFIVGIYLDGEMFYAIGNTIVALLFLVSLFIVESKVDGGDTDIDSINGLALLSIPLISIILIIIIVYNGNNIGTVVLACISILLINTISFYLYNWIIKTYSNKNKQDLLEKQLESYHNQIEVMRQSQQRVNSLKHDMKHHMLVINDMAMKNSNKEVIEYLEKMKDEINNPREYVNSGNEAIDVMLNYKISQVKLLTDNITIKVKVPEDIELDKFDLNIILGNLLENSLRALREIEKRELVVLIKYEKSILYINVKNSYSGILEKKGSKLISTKKSTGVHGIGLENVNKVVDKYNGMMSISSDDKTFIVDIMLYV